MKLFAKPALLGILSALTLTLTACQTTSRPSSSDLVETVASQTEAEITYRICEALRPERIGREDYDASPPAIRQAIAQNAAAWVATCQQ